MKQLLSTVEAVPSRVLGLLRYLAAQKGPESKSNLLACLSPPAIRQGDMANKVLRACINCGFVLEEGEQVSLAPEVRQKCATRGEETHSQVIRRYVADRILTDSDDTMRFNIAWLLTFDPIAGPVNWAGLTAAAYPRHVEVIHGRLNDAGWGSLHDWAWFLGFSTQDEFGNRPDPTAFLGSVLEELFTRRGERRPLPEFLDHLARIAPVFEGGTTRAELHGLLGLPLHGDLSRTTSLALLSLHEQGVLELGRESDAELVTLEDEQPVSYSYVAWREAA